MHGKSPGRFIFSIRDEDIQFNYSIVVDILYMEWKSADNKPVLHIVDEATRFQAGRWLKDISARHVWDQLRASWIDTYLGSPDLITADAGKQFVAREFKQYAGNMGITVKTAPVEAHHSIGMVERYHGPLRRVYAIITAEISGIDPEIALQMAFKALNDSVGPDGLVLILLVFGAYPRMIEMDASSLTITQRAIAMRKAMEEVQKFIATRQMNDALNTRNGLIITLFHGLSLNSSVLVFREGKGTNQSGAWKGPFKLLSIQSESAIIELPNEPIKFRTISVKSYYQDDHADNSDELSLPPSVPSLIGSSIEPSIESSAESITEHTNPTIDSIVPTGPVKRGRGRPRKYLASTANFIFNTTAESVVSSFTVSRQKEIAGLLEKGVFISVNKGDVPADVRIFSSRFVDEIKHSGIEKAFEKSRLVVQAFNDQNKTLVLTQSLIIQRVSQRLIICLAATLSMELYLRDIIQAYVQSRSTLNRDFYVQSFPELIKLMGVSSDCILKVVKPLYGVSEAGNHWFKTYHGHHTDKLGMIPFTYDSCLLYTPTSFQTGLGIVGMQTDDTLILADQSFAAVEEEAVHSTKIMTKAREQLTSTNPLKFNGTRIERIGPDGVIYFRQETHIQGIQLVNSTESTIITSARGKIRAMLILRDQYIAQRARGAYLASICQPEASFDLSRAAQSIEITSDDIISLNKRLNWQIINQSRGLKYVRLDQTSLRLVVFIDSSFVNNSDLFSQIGYVICLADDTHANILHWSSIKCKRVTRSVLAAELFAMVHGFDVGSVLKSTLIKMLGITVLLILVTDSKSLYDCLVRLGTTVEKRLMIDVMALRQFYKRREITEVIWIHDINNPADSMIKVKSSTVLKTVIDINQINLDTTEWVERATARETANQGKGTGPDKVTGWDEIFREMGVFSFFKEVRVLVRTMPWCCYTICS